MYLFKNYLFCTYAVRGPRRQRCKDTKRALRWLRRGRRLGGRRQSKAMGTERSEFESGSISDKGLDKWVFSLGKWGHYHLVQLSQRVS